MQNNIYKFFKYKPFVPHSPLITSVVSGNQFVDISWTVPFNAGYTITSYNLYIKNMSTDLTDVINLTPDILSYKVQNLTNGILYNFNVSAVNEKGEGDLSRTISSKPASVPSSVNNLTRILTVISWSIPISDGGEPILKYNIYYNGTIIYETSNTQFSGSFMNGTYSVSAVNIIGEGEITNLIIDGSSSESTVINNLVSVTVNRDGSINKTYITTGSGGSSMTGAN